MFRRVFDFRCFSCKSCLSVLVAAVFLFLIPSNLVLCEIEGDLNSYEIVGIRSEEPVDSSFSRGYGVRKPSGGFPKKRRGKPYAFVKEASKDFRASGGSAILTEAALPWMKEEELTSFESPPTLFIPGFGGSGLYASFLNSDLPLCPPEAATENLKRMWVPLIHLSGGAEAQNCWLQKLSLLFNNSSNLYSSVDGATYRSGTIGKTRDIQFLDYFMNFGLPGTDYLDNLIGEFNALEIPTYGFPYDWRFPIRQINFDAFKGIIERVVKQYGKKMCIAAHSYGAVVATYFFNKIVDQAWKDEHIESFISISGAFGGSPLAAKAILFGHDPTEGTLWGNQNLVTFQQDTLFEVEKSLGSIYSLLPSAEVLGSDYVILKIKEVDNADSALSNSTPTVIKETVYTLRNWTETLSEELKYKAEIEATIMEDHGLRDPGVPVYCLWSLTKDNTTATSFLYDRKATKSALQTSFGEGDGTLVPASLKWCAQWNSTVRSLHFEDATHGDFVKRKELLEAITSIISEHTEIDSSGQE